MKAMRKKVTLLEVAIHSLKIKLREVESEAAKNIEKAKIQVEREKE
jgi:hypothetical protein